WSAEFSPPNFAIGDDALFSPARFSLRAFPPTKVRAPIIAGGAGIEDLRDIRMIHHRQRLSFGLEASDHGLSVHSEFDDLKGDAAPDRLGLLGDIDDT